MRWFALPLGGGFSCGDRMRPSKKIARELRARLRIEERERIAGPVSWESVRDQVDTETGGDLSNWQLNTLTDWVLERTR